MPMALKTIKKQLLRVGEWFHPSAPNGKLTIGKPDLEEIAQNFKHTPYAPVTRGHVSQEEMEKDPSLIISKNIKELELNENGLDAVMEVEEGELEKYNDVSVSLNFGYENHETGEKIGKVIEHVAFTVNPYLKGLNPFVPLSEQKNKFLINLSEIKTMDEEKKTTQVEETSTETEETTTPKVEETKVEETSETPSETEEKKTPVETAEEAEALDSSAKVEASESKESDLESLRAELAETKAKLAKQEAEGKYNALLSEGKVLPTQKETVVALLSQKETSINLAEGGEKTIEVLLNDFFAKQPKLINLEEKGVNIEDSKNVQATEAWRTKLQDLRLSDAHKDKTDEQWNEYVKKNEKHIKPVIEKTYNL